MKVEENSRAVEVDQATRLPFARHRFPFNIQIERETGFEDDQPCNVGQCIRMIREKRSMSLRALAEASRLSVNTISCIENGKTSPSVSTLQKIAASLKVPVVALFVANQQEKKVVYTKQGKRKSFPFEAGWLEDLGEGLTEGALEPFLVNMAPNSASGPAPITHPGHEFVLCLGGRVNYTIEDKVYFLDAGDSLFFKSCMPHCWQNPGREPAKIALILCPANAYECSIEQHFSMD